MDKYFELKERIKHCNLPPADKEILIKKLTGKNVDFDSFLQVFLRICDVASAISKLSDIDIGSF